MTAQTPRRREGRILPLLAHYNPLLLIVSGVILFAPLGGDFVGTAITYFGAALFAVALTTQVRHAYNYLCVRCATATPLDGPAEAARRHRSLTTFHWFCTGRRGQVVALTTLALFLSPVAITLLVGHAPWPRFLAMAAWAYWIVESFLYLRHLPVQPWCPQCHWDDGGDEEESPIIPDPVAASDR